MLLSDFDYNLPPERIAKQPPRVRGSSRLLVLDRQNQNLIDSHYANLADFLSPGDLVILNDTRVMRARLFCTLPDGRKRELIVLEKHGQELEKVLYRGKLHAGDVLTLQASSPLKDTPKTTKNTATITIKNILEGGVATVSSPQPLQELAAQYGTVPLPPYLHRAATAADIKRYQSVWAKNTGSAAAPTASLNMTKATLASLESKGVQIKHLTLHVGLGTFLPIRSDKIEEHHMHSEWFHLPSDTITAINNTKAKRHKVVAIGTTVARTLEYYAQTGVSTGEADIFIYPGFNFQIVDALLTNFHAPKSTVLMLAAAFAGWDNLKRAYHHCIDAKYAFLSYGDSMLIY